MTSRTIRRLVSERVPVIGLSSLLLMAFAMMFVQPAQAHGYIQSPASRAYLCSTGVNTNCGEIQYEPQSLEGPGGFPIGGPPDGQIASAGLSEFSPLNAQSATRWHKVSVTSGTTMQFKWVITASHVTENFRYYITKPNWDPSQPLTRADFEPLPFCIQPLYGARPGATVTDTCTLPNRSGYQIILGLYEVYDGGHNAFYQVVDVDFGDGPPASGGLGGLNCTILNAWNANTAYAAGTNVSYNGYSYHAKRNVPAGMEPDTNSNPGGIWLRNGPCGPSGNNPPPSSGGNNPPPGSGGNNPPPSSGGNNPPPSSGGNNPPPSSGGSCANVSQWNDTTHYVGGDQVVYDGELYTANWNTTGTEPDTHSGNPGSIWTDNGSCGGGNNPPPSSGNPPPSSGGNNPPPSSGGNNPPPSSGGSCANVPTWSASSVYTGGDQVQYDGNIYSANWWTQGTNPASNSGQWSVWTLVGACSGGNNPPPSSGGNNPPPSSGGNNPPPSSGGNNPPPSSGGNNPPPSSGNPPPSSGNPPPSSGGSSCSGAPQYVDGSSYATGDTVQNNGHEYQCTVGGWCTVGGPYAPGTGWAWSSAWSDLGACTN